jgi:hypothetical protein
MKKLLKLLQVKGWKIIKVYKGGYSAPKGFVAVKGHKAIEAVWVHWTGTLQVNKCFFA